MFYAVCFYGHNENLANDPVDLQCMGDSRHVLGMDFIDSYKKEVGASEPVVDFDDRHELYALSKEKMRQMIAKFPGGFSDFQEKSDGQTKL
ncbi:hypothetical protein PG994_013302 [Apiospora phragmitis]|uniref:Uncharacterized protein n=1 Tax=Apiospora phragmitis TaxID=2905665 RepID=A0ABR1T8A0_9PEZI